MYTTINNIVDNSIGNLESDMLEYISERDRYRTFEVISLIKSIFDRNHIIWALYDEYIECRKDGKCPETIIIVVGQEYRNIALNIFNVLGERVNNVVFLINNIKDDHCHQHAKDNKKSDLLFPDKIIRCFCCFNRNNITDHPVIHPQGCVSNIIRCFFSFSQPKLADTVFLICKISFYLLDGSCLDLIIVKILEYIGEKSFQFLICIDTVIGDHLSIFVRNKAVTFSVKQIIKHHTA